MNARTALIAGVAALVLNASMVGASTPAQARNGGAIAAGVIGGLAVGAIAGSALSSRPAYGYAPSYVDSAPPVYVEPEPVYGGGCYFSRQATYDPYGEFAGYRRIRVCD